MSEPNRLSADELEDLHGHRLAEWVELVGQVMTRLGVPAELRGIRETGPRAVHTTGQPFTFETAQGGRNTKPGRQPMLESRGLLRVDKRGINVDGAVLDDNLLPHESWRFATVEVRMEAVVAHEFSEFRSPSLHYSWRHMDAILRSRSNPLLSEEARRIIEDQLRAALAGEDPQTIPMVANRIRSVLQSAERRAVGGRPEGSR